ncbi:hypothetical protein E1B28_006664 [Marasmius oreades]|uniref:Uncharacterized protein n=1 Tax=Marasmius oreades TaxID=181124 RepID=A0A9P8A9N9_9AGAR|nr:uncharacterized protein E1B28_006664 [Marasmius oreades]KAG7095981.1 hypothetical protein E1B28_006664 [Marasmius oreades]
MSDEFELQDYTFSPSPTDPSTWTRKCHGFESFVSVLSENLGGCPFLTTTISIKPAYDRAILEPVVKAAWIALRYTLPAIAVKSSRLPAPDSHFILTYRTPKDTGELQTWANETVFFTDEVNDVYDAHKKLKNERWWKPSGNHWIGELHVSPIKHGWQFSIVFNHGSHDSRSAFGILNELLGKLVPILEGSAVPELSWGEETKRLPPTSNVINAKANALPKEDQPPLPLSQSTLWTWTPVKISSPINHDVSALITLPVETTSKLHMVSKLHGRTISRVVTALSILAHTEVCLKAAAEAGPERFKVVSTSYKESEVYQVALTFANYRHKFPEPYNRLSSETPGPLATFDGMPLFLSMDPIRKFFTIDDTRSTVVVNSKDLLDAFWNELVDATVKSWKDHDHTLEGYATREADCQVVIHEYDPNILNFPALVTSSVGDLQRLGIFDEYLPSLENKTQPLTVVDTIIGQRMRAPMLMNMFWQYDGKLNCHWFTGGEWMTEEQLGMAVDSFKRWIEIFVESEE